MTRQEAKELALKHCKPFFHHAFDRWVFPAIRSIQAAPLLSEIMSVQPMSEPSGEMFYLDFVYDSKWERFKRWIKSWIKRIRRRWPCEGPGQGCRATELR